MQTKSTRKHRLLPLGMPCSYAAITLQLLSHGSYTILYNACVRHSWILIHETAGILCNAAWKKDWYRGKLIQPNHQWRFIFLFITHSGTETRRPEVGVHSSGLWVFHEPLGCESSTGWPQETDFWQSSGWARLKVVHSWTHFRSMREGWDGWLTTLQLQELEA